MRLHLILSRVGPTQIIPPAQLGQGCTLPLRLYSRILFPLS
jgi:hypothetical protein